MVLTMHKNEQGYMRDHAQESDECVMTQGTSEGAELLKQNNVAGWLLMGL